MAAKPPIPTVDDVRGCYAHVRNMLDRLPDGRMRSLAVTALEESFSRALFAISKELGLDVDPIRGSKR